MGEIYELTEEELSTWRLKVLNCERSYSVTKDVRFLTLFIIWLYEFAEAFAVNNLGLQAKLGRAKDKYSNSEFVRSLFTARGKLVHRPYKLSADELDYFYISNKQNIQQLMKECGFQVAKEMHSFNLE